MYYKYFVMATLGLFFGIIFAFKLNFSSEIFILSIILFLINIFIYKFSKRQYGIYKSKIPIIISCFFLFIAIGILFGQYNISKDLIRKNNFEFFLKNNLKENEKNKSGYNFIGKIIFIEKGEISQKIFLNIYNENNEREIYKIKIVTQIFPEYKNGDYLKIYGKIEEENILFPNLIDSEKSFNLENYNNLNNIDGTILFPKIEIIDKNNFNISQTNNLNNIISNFIIYLSNLRNEIIEKLENNLERNTAALNAGVLLGDHSLFNKDELNNFRISGLSHIIVLSGFNISILILTLFFILSFLSFRYKIFFVILFIIIFVLFVGPSSSILRASIMGIIILLSQIHGKQYMAKQALFISVFFMLIFNPKIAIYDISFHLSFLATFGILYISPIFNFNKKFFSVFAFFSPRPLRGRGPNDDTKQDNDTNQNGEINENKFLKNIFEILKGTFSAQLMVTPYLMFAFGHFSFLSLIANILIIPIVPIIMLFAFLIISFSYLHTFILFIFSNSYFSFLSFISKTFLIFFSYIDFYFSKYVFYIAEFMAKIQFNQNSNYISIYIMFIIYIIIISLILFEEKRKRIEMYLKK